MKKIILIISLWLIMLFGSISGLLLAQNSELNNLIPLDSKVRFGKLDNGMTYYILKNSKPEKRVELRLAVNIGSVAEDDDQQGLAHFVEHMCFNGTKNFAKNDLVHYLQSVGVSFGADVNAFTSFDETVYMLTVPTDSANVLNKGMLIMNDWASQVSFDSMEIEKERGVVIEEWRLGRGAHQRMSNKYLPILFSDSRYASRLPIGLKEIIEKASQKTIKKFYSDWYRPDLMAFIVVGDIDPDLIEKKIKDEFGKIAKKENPRKREEYKIPDQPLSQVCVVSDKENPYPVVSIIYKSDPLEVKTDADYRQTIIHGLFTGMMSLRLEELKSKSNPPFNYSWVQYGDLASKSKAAYQLGAVVGADGQKAGLKALLEENEKVKRFGFQQSEFDRYKKILLNQIEQQYSERDKTESENVVWNYVWHFLKNDPAPGIEYVYDYYKKNLDGILLNEVNQLAIKCIHPENRVVLILGLDNESVKNLTEAEINEIIRDVEQSKIEAYQDHFVGGDLLTQKPVGGKITKENKLNDVGITEWSLSNGAKVILKPTDFKNDEILLNAFSYGGQSLFPDSYHQSAMNTIGYISESGVDRFSKTDLEKMLAGKQLSLNPQINLYSEGFIGNSSMKDFETMLQLMYLYFTSPRKDEEAFNSFLLKQQSFMKNVLTDPVNSFFDKMERIQYNNHPRLTNIVPSENDYKKVKLDQIMEIYKDRFADASDFTFVFVGSFKSEEIKPIIEKYIAGLPGKNRKESYKDLKIDMKKGQINEKVLKGTDQKSFTSFYTEKKFDYNMTDAHLVWSLSNILDRIYIDKLREELSGVYGFQFSAKLEKIPAGKFNMQLIIPCAPENVDKLVNAALDEIKNIQVSGVKAEDLQKELESQKRQIEKESKENNAWLWKIEKIYSQNEDLTRLKNMESLLSMITSDNLKRIANTYFKFDDFVRVTLYPEK